MSFFFSKAFEDLGAATDSSAFLGGIRNVAFSFMILGAIILLSMTVQTMLMETAAGEMTREMKNSWFRALLRQDMAYHDIRDVPGQATLITANGSRYRKGVGRKLSEAVQFFIAFIGSLAYSFWSSW
jgi:ATP-binding cassette, subfamily B (MDR/TAP), member 1